MTDHELEQRLRAWYAAEVDGIDGAPADLREGLAAIPVSTPVARPPLSRRRGMTLLAVAAVLVVGGAVAAGSGFLTPKPIVTPPPNVAVVPPSALPAPSAPSPTVPALRPGTSIAFIKTVQLKPVCPRFTSGCVVARVWLIGSDGQDAHPLSPAGVTGQFGVAWSPDGTSLLYSDDGKLYVTDATGREARLVDTGCASPCFQDSVPEFSRDGRSIVFVRSSVDAVTEVVTMDLASGAVSELRSTASDATAAPRWSPDGHQIVFFRFGEKDGGGPVPPRLSAVWVVDADGQNLRQVSPLTLAAENPDWSPDGGRILFESGPITGLGQDIYTIRPDGTDVRQLTSDGSAISAGWTPDGRILFVRNAGGAQGEAPGWWTMDADGTHAALLVAGKTVSADVANIGTTDPVWQPVGGPAVVSPPWTAATGIAVGPPAPTPSPTETPSLAPGFAWAGTGTTPDGGQLQGTATLLADGHVLFAGSCTTAAELYDPSTGLFTPTGSMTTERAATAATRLQDGRVLFTGGSPCGDTGGIWASAEVYDPATGTFSPTGSMHTPRASHTSTLMADGRVLITGGITGSSPAASTSATLAAFRLVDTSANVLKTAEIYDPATGTFSKTGSMSSIRDSHTATLLTDGRVLVVGGGGEGYAGVTSVDLYDPTTGTFKRTGSIKGGRWLHAATLLRDGRVLITGGRSSNDSSYASAEIYDPASGRFSSTDAMDDGRQQHTATLLQDGRVLVTGGYWSDGHSWKVLSATEIFDPATEKFSPTGSMGAAREDQTATLLDDGRVLIAGGDAIGNSGAASVPSAVLYQP
jgi:hypothetical protein